MIKYLNITSIKKIIISKIENLSIIPNDVLKLLLYYVLKENTNLKTQLEDHEIRLELLEHTYDNYENCSICDLQVDCCINYNKNHCGYCIDCNKL